MASGPITSWQIDGETVTDYILGGSKITADGDCSHEIKRRLLLWRKVMTNLDIILKSRDITNKGPSSQSYGFSSSHIWMWEMDYKESWVLKNWCFWTVVLEKTLESPLNCKGIKPVHPKGNQSWVFIGRTDAEAETPILWPTDAENWVIGKCWMLGKMEKAMATHSSTLAWKIPWIEACQASPSISNSQSLLRLMFIELVMPSSAISISSHLQSFPESGSFPMS